MLSDLVAVLALTGTVELASGGLTFRAEARCPRLVQAVLSRPQTRGHLMGPAGTKTICLRSKRYGRAHYLPNALLREAALSLPDSADDQIDVEPNLQDGPARALLLRWTIAPPGSTIPEWAVERVAKDLVISAHGSPNESGALGHLSAGAGWKLFGGSLPEHQVVPSTAVLAAGLFRLLLLRDGTTEFMIMEGDSFE